MRRISWGFIGCGEVTELKSGPTFNEVEGSHVEAVYSRSKERMLSYARHHHIKKQYTDVQQLIDDPEVNAIYIATPPSSRAIYTIMAAKAGKPAYIKKPLAAGYEDYARINRVSQQTGVPYFIAYYRRYLPYFRKMESILDSGTIGTVTNVQVRFSVPSRDLDYSGDRHLPWRLQPDIAGSGYFYDLAPHQLDLLQGFFGVITQAHGRYANHAHLYSAEDTISACLLFENGLLGNGSWCLVGHQSTKEDSIDVVSEQGSLLFSVYNYHPIQLIASNGIRSITVPNLSYVQLPIIKTATEDLQGIGVYACTGISTTLIDWVMGRILGKF